MRIEGEEIDKEEESKEDYVPDQEDDLEEIEEGLEVEDLSTTISSDDVPLRDFMSSLPKRRRKYYS